MCFAVPSARVHQQPVFSRRRIFSIQPYFALYDKQSSLLLLTSTLWLMWHCKLMLMGCRARSFREAVLPVVEALVSSQWFAALPGPARVTTLDTVVCSMVGLFACGRASKKPRGR